MKILYVFLLIAVVLASCSRPSTVVGIPFDAQETTIDETAIKSHELPDDSYSEWQTIEQEWIKNCLNPTLKKHKIDVNCDDCPRVVLKIKLKIDDTGKLDSYEIINFNVCGRDNEFEIKIDLLTYLATYTYPESLRGLVIEAYLGRVLKC